VFSLGFWEKPFQYWFGFGGAISTLARQEGNPSRISIGDRKEGWGSIQGLQCSFTWEFFLLLEIYGSVVEVYGVSWTKSSLDIHVFLKGFTEPGQSHPHGLSSGCHARSSFFSHLFHGRHCCISNFFKWGYLQTHRDTPSMGGKLVVWLSIGVKEEDHWSVTYLWGFMDYNRAISYVLQTLAPLF